MNSHESVARGQEAYARQEWASARGLFHAADGEAELEPEDLERLALCAGLLGRDSESEAAWDRAHRAWLARGEIERAARCAFWVGFSLQFRGEVAQAAGWTARVQRLLDEHEIGAISAVRGLLLIYAGVGMTFGGDAGGAYDMFVAATAIGEQLGDLDVRTFGRHGQGQALIAQGETAAGLALLDEVMIDLTVETLSPRVVGVVYCAVIEACHDLFELRRAREWTSALTRWCSAQPDLVPYRGNCLVHRSEILQVHGDWSEAMSEARRACEWLSDPPSAPAGNAFYQLGELHRLRGELAAAEESYRQANQFGREPQPGLALLRLAQGQLDVAVASINRTLDEHSHHARRPQLLAAHVEIMLAAGDVTAARTASDALTSMAERRDAELLQATAMHATGITLRAEGDARRALATLRRARMVWQQVGAPYDAARARVEIALACRTFGDEDAARMELDAARWVFDQVGALPDVARVDSLASGKALAAIPAGLTLREVEVLRLVATGMTNRAIADALFLSERTVARHIANIFAKIDVSSRSAATAFAYEHELA